MCTRIQCAAGLKPLNQRVFSWFRQKRLWVETSREHPTTHISSVSARHAWRNWRPLEVNLWPEREKARVVLSRVHTTSLHKNARTVHHVNTRMFSLKSHIHARFGINTYTHAHQPTNRLRAVRRAHYNWHRLCLAHTAVSSGGCQHKVVVTPSGGGHPCAIELQISGTAPEQIYKGDLQGNTRFLSR